MPTATLTTEVDVPQDWLDFMVDNTDMFRTDHAGYWAHGAHHSRSDRRWLIYEHCDEKRPTTAAIDEALLCLAEKRPLPERWFVLDDSSATKAYLEGVKRWGLDWYDGEHSDATGYDVVLQLALLGEVRYA